MSGTYGGGDAEGRLKVWASFLWATGSRGKVLSRGDKCRVECNLEGGVRKIRKLLGMTAKQYLSPTGRGEGP